MRCLVVDDHILVRQGVRRLLEDEPDFEVVGEAGNAAEALRKVLEHQPDLVVMDVGMPGMSPFEAARLIQRDYPHAKVLFLTMHEDEEYVMQALAAGVAGYVLKDTSAAGLISALREVYRGGNYVSPQVLSRLVENVSAGSAGTRLVPRSDMLTPREREVTRMIAEGNSAKEIAQCLGLSVKTVEAHKFNLMRKLDIHNKAQLVTYAIQKRIVKMPVDA
ncbi:MAG: response regulator transcription factor [Acidobacteriia bacterium]|nr:response regulator transcription factor [Terriglobia bacterium]